jgi:hypothetical protein
MSLLSVNTNLTGAGSDSAVAVLLSADGHTVVFASTASDLLPDDQNGAQDIFSWAIPPPGTAQPRLSIQRAGESFILEWPAETPPGFVLETTTNLTPPAIWDVISNATSPFVVTNTPADRGQFYRMRMP